MKQALHNIREQVNRPMPPEQEQGYTLACAQQLLRYAPLLVAGIMAVQVYNLGYALVYTGGRLHTTASRVYAALYIALLLASAAVLALGRRFRRGMPGQARQIVRLQVVYAMFLMAWSACVTVYDQRVSSNISVYMIVALTIAVLARFTPLQAAAAYGAILAALYRVLPLFQRTPADNYGIYANLAIMTLMSVFVCCYRYYLDRRHFLEQQIIAAQNLQLKESATIDPLTRLRNRRFLDEQIDAWCSRCAADGAEMTFMMIDIDHFKQYNDTYGHLQGDECLRRVAWCLLHKLDSTHEHLIRYGGEEFLYIGLGVDAADGMQKAQGFLEAIRGLVTGLSGQDSRSVTVSIGVCTGRPAAGDDWAGCVADADKALYLAKNSGRDRCAQFRR